MLRIVGISLSIFALVGCSFTDELGYAGTGALHIKPTVFTTDPETPDANIETQIFDVLIQDYPIDSIAFSRSILTDKPLMIRLSYNKNLHSYFEDQWLMMRRLLKKYGTPTRVMGDTLQWSTPDVVINAEGSKRVVSYYYLQHISEHCNLGNQTAISLIPKISLM